MAHTVMRGDERLTLDQVHPDRLYTAEQVAQVLDLNVDSVYRIGVMKNSPLPKVALGPRGGKTKFRGRDVLRYAGTSKAVY